MHHMIWLILWSYPLGAVVYVLLRMTGLRAPADWGSSNGSWKPARASQPHDDHLWDYSKHLGAVAPYAAVIVAIAGFFVFLSVAILVVGDSLTRVYVGGLIGGFAFALALVIHGRKTDHFSIEMMGYGTAIAWSIVVVIVGDGLSSVLIY